MSARGRPIVITGFMGAGKSTVARALAARLGCRLIDLDSFIDEREGRTAQQIIEASGEQAFREVESLALGEALGAEGACVIALGGGAWTVERNRALVASRGGFTVWLDAPFELCWERITGVENNLRPLARNMESAHKLYDVRRALYGLASTRIEAGGGKSPEAIAAEIEDLIRKGRI